VALTLRPFPESTIRALASLLTALLLAIGLGLAGYCAIVVVARNSSGAAPPPPVQHTPLPVLPPLSRLDPVAETKRFAAPAADRRNGIAPFVVTIVVRGVSAALRTTTGGVWLARADGQGNRTWLSWHDPAANAPVTTDIVLTASLDQPGDYVVAAATAREFGQHGYLARRTATCTAATTIDIDASTSEVVFRLPPLARQVGPLRVARVDDPHWLPIATLPIGLILAPGSPTRCRLGNGAYELYEPLRPDVRQTFAVPAAGDVVINASLATPRADRP
jgi:hypothetical protein